MLARNCMNIDMAQMNVSLPEGMKAWAEARVAEGRYSSTSDYVRYLMRRDLEAAEAIRRQEAAIDEGPASQVGDTTIHDISARGRARQDLTTTRMNPSHYCASRMPSIAC